MLLLLFAAAAVAASPAPFAPWQNTSLPIDARVANLVSLLTLEEKIANLYSNAAPGSPRLGLPPYRYDEECMRGAVTSGVAPRPLGTGFPTLLALAGTFNVSLLAAVGAVGAREVRAYYNIDRRTAGLSTTANCYAPVVNLVRVCQRSCAPPSKPTALSSHSYPSPIVSAGARREVGSRR